MNTMIFSFFAERQKRTISHFKILHRRLKGVVFLLLTAFLVNAQAKPNEIPNEKVTLQLKWLHQFQFAGYYAAQKQGYFDEEGLDVEIKERNLLENNIEQVMRGEAEYGISDSVLLLYQAKKAPIVIVAPIFQHSPQVLLTLKTSGLDSPYKLKNKSFAFYQKDTDGFSLLAMFQQIGIQPNYDRVVIKNDPGMLERGEVDAYAAYITNESYYFQQKGEPINIIKPMNYGIDLYGDMLFTSQHELKNHPDRVKRFRRAVIKGWEYALNHKQEMAHYIKDTYQVEKSLEHLLFEADAIEEIMSRNTTPIGTLDEGRVQFIANLFKKHGLIENNIDLNKGIYRPEASSLNFSEQEKQWMQQHPVIKLAVDPNWEPIEFVDDKQNFQGISAEFLRYIANKTSLKFEPNFAEDWAETVNKMKERKLDVYSAIVSTEERKEYVNYSNPYLSLPMGIVTHTHSSYISDMSQLKGQVVSVVNHYATHEILRSRYPEISLYLVNSVEEGLRAVSQGKAFAYLDNVAVLGHHIKTLGLGNLQISGEAPFRADVSIGIRNDWPELYSIIQKTLQNMTAKERESLTNPWLQVSYQKQYNWQQMMLVIAPIMLILFIIIGYNRKLNKVNKQLSATNQELQTTQAALERTNIQLGQLSITDHLTGIYNRQHLDQVLTSEIQRANRYLTPLSLLMIDLDDFKQKNDVFGHLVGDQVLVTSTQIISQISRKTDVFGRWGGEEFIVICPETNQEQALAFAEKIRKTIEETPFPQAISQTLSIGIAEYQTNQSDTEFVSQADKALYKAKHLGKNRVFIA